MAKKMKSLGGRSLSKKTGSKTDMNKMLQEAQRAQVEMQEELDKLDEELSNVEVEATAGGGVVKVVATCDMRIKDIVISEEVEDEDIDTLKDLIIAASNEAIEKASKLKEEKTNEISQKFLGTLPNFGA
ncbi:conserved hypothetical protein [Petrotoga mobilis SJ95]|jgi:hypothetical protein|uniref:Nucleoid-associated protein Pmob_1446 n=1 Tax=Petrotoga mobilis (strain DSM 10674 / SJ95) TaxID=403833 RepID=A9BII6_PETMO|nr:MULTISPECIES: YbaB/EbfC family nucleoid-associated protein [Petrotoga]MDK2811932.1 nucleoid-associated protein EbfC [Petrotoga sp.]ABX32149.1 conserved hypothetical protein [Petrotoga mobilis SJ95]MBL5981473.1 hypothetical protein [Petrotoga sp. 8T1HF07.NaAc.6.1]PNR90095.1 DNA-binding protein [Petrotoga sp. 9T1HF07.CasAA.8.2]PNR92381.1 DNA-binding protein [Petrotoga sp. HWHPT.55.6.3]